MTLSNDKRNAKLAQQEENITAIFNSLLTDLRIQLNKEIQNEVNKQCKHIESKSKMLKQRLSELWKLNINN